MPLRTPIDRFPYPVALPCSIAVDAGQSPQVRLWNLPFAGYQILRTATLPVLAAYLDDPLETDKMPSKGAVEAMAGEIAGLSRPYFNNWITLLETLVPKLTRANVSMDPVLPLARGLDALKAAKRIPLDGYSSSLSPAPPHRLLRDLRNGLAHGGALPEDAACHRLLDHYLPVLEDFLNAFNFLADCELRVREGAFDGDATLVRILRGPEIPEPIVIGDDEDWIDALRSSTVAMKAPVAGILPLYPLFSIGSTAPLGLYDGHYLYETMGGGTSGKKVREQQLVYLGAGHDRWRDAAGFDEFKNKLDRRRVRWFLKKEHLAPWTILDSIRFTSSTAVRSLEGWKYFPKCHVEREDLRRVWERFLKADENEIGVAAPDKNRRYRSGFLLAGAAGSGKSAWCAHSVAKLLEEGFKKSAGDDPGPDGKNLVLFLRGSEIAEREGREDRLLTTLLERIGLRNEDFAGFSHFLTALNKKIPDDRVKGRQFILVLDALNEAPRPENLLREILDLMNAAASFPWCKVAVTVREEFLGVLRGKQGRSGTERDILSGAESFLFLPEQERENEQFRTHRSLRLFHDLRLLSEEETSTAYERYRAEGLTSDQPGCKTPWKALGSETRKLLGSPLLLYVFHRRFSGRPAEQIQTRPALFSRYVDGLFNEFSGLRESSEKVVRLVLDNQRADLNEQDLATLRHAWAQGRTPGERRLEFDTVETVINAGLLRRRLPQEGGGLAFAFETVLEYLIFRFWESESPNLDIDFLKQKVEAGKASKEFPEYWNAFLFVFERLLHEQRPVDWPRLVNGVSPKELGTVAGRVWAAAVVECQLPSDTPEDQLRQTEVGKIALAFGSSAAVSVLDHFHQSLSRLVRPEWEALILRIWKERIGEKGGVGIDLAGVEMRLGNAMLDLGRLPDAIEAYTGAKFILSRLVEQEGRKKFESDLAAVEGNLGAALREFRRFPEAVEAFTRAKSIWLRLIEQEGRKDVENEFATLEANLGNAMLDLGHLPEALEAFTRAKLIRARLVGEEGRQDLEEYLASVECDIGNALMGLGRLPEALEAYQQARSIRLRLVEDGGRKDQESRLAGAEMNLGNALRRLGRLPGAIEAFARAKSIWLSLIEQDGRKELEDNLASVEINLGIALKALGRLPEAVEAFRRATSIRTRLVENKEHRGNEWASAEMVFGSVLSDLGSLPEAVEAYERAKSIRLRLVEKEGRKELENDLASVEYNLGAVLQYHGRFSDALVSHTRAKSIWEKLVEQDGRKDLEKRLASADMGIGIALKSLGRLPDALAAYAQAQSILLRLVEQEGRKDLENELASADMGLGTVLQSLGRLPDARAVYMRARLMRMRLVEQGRRDLEDDLASVEYNLGTVLHHLDLLPEAIEAYSRAKSIWDRLVDQETRKNLRKNLATVEMNLGIANWGLGRLSEAVDAYTRARFIHISLVEQEGVKDLENDLATVEMLLGFTLFQLGRFPEAVEADTRAKSIWSGLVEQGGRKDLENELAKVERNLGNALRELGRLPEAIEEYQNAHAIWLRLVEQDGKHEFVGGVVNSLFNMTVVLTGCPERVWETQKQKIVNDLLSVARLLTETVGWDNVPEDLRRNFIGMLEQVHAAGFCDVECKKKLGDILHNSASWAHK